MFEKFIVLAKFAGSGFVHVAVTNAGKREKELINGEVAYVNIVNQEYVNIVNQGTIFRKV